MCDLAYLIDSFMFYDNNFSGENNIFNQNLLSIYISISTNITCMLNYDIILGILINAFNF